MAADSQLVAADSQLVAADIQLVVADSQLVATSSQLAAAGMLGELYRRAASPLLLLVLQGANKPLLAGPFMGRPTRR